MANQYLPDTFGAMTNAYAAGQDLRRRKDVNALASQAYGASGDARQQAIQQMVAVDPAAAFQVDDQLESREAKMAKKLGGAARYLKQAVDSGNPQQIQGAWNAVRPMLQREMPQGQFSEQWDPATMEPVLHEVLAMTSGGDDGYRVQSTKIGADGFIYTIGRDGTPVNTGIKADPRTQFVDVPGVGPQMVTMSGDQRGTAAPVMPAGSPQAGAHAAAPPAYGPPPEINVQALPGADIPPQDLPAMMAAAENPGSVVAVAPNGGASMLAAPPVAAQPAAPAWVRPDYAGQNAVRADAAAQRAAAAEARAAERSGIPAGYEPDGMGGARPIKGGPADPEVIARNKSAGGGAKPMPAGAVAKDLEIQDALSATRKMAQVIKKHADRLVSKELQISPVNAIGARGREFVGQANENDVNLAELRSDMTSIVNEGLRLNKGVQTEGDAQRAYKELMTSNDPAVVARALKRLAEFSQMATQAQLSKREVLYRNYGREAQGQSQPQPQQSAAPARPTTDAEFDALPSGALFVDPDDGQTYRKP